MRLKRQTMLSARTRRDATSTRVLLVINARVSDTAREDISAGRWPRKDYFELQRALDADMIDLGALDKRRWTRLVRRYAGASIAQALLAWTMSGRYDAVFADRETTGFLLAALSRLRRRRPRLTMIGHLLSHPKKRMVFHALRLHKTVDCVIVHSSVQQRIAHDVLGLPPRQVALVPYQSDELFWAPRVVPLKKQIVSVGNEHRDYTTLFNATAHLDLDTVIVASSHWSKHNFIAGSGLPDRVRIASYLTYQDLRQLYAESLFVVVPLYDVDFQAGITTILEAMAMGKAVVVSHARGQMDVVRDRRFCSRSDPERLTQSDWARRLGAAEHIAQGHTGIYVTPGSAEELQRAITFLVGHPEQAREMGANGRRLIKETMSLDQFTDRIIAFITGKSGESTAITTLGKHMQHSQLPLPAPTQELSV